MSIALGFLDAPRCLPCLARALSEPPQTLHETLFAYIRSKRCYSEAWNWASRQVGAATAELLPLLDEEILPAPSIPPNAATWDAGDAGCGELALELRMRMQRLEPGAVLHLITRDLGAPEDVPAWCRLTGHTLLRAEPPSYWIAQKLSQPQTINNP